MLSIKTYGLTDLLILVTVSNKMTFKAAIKLVKFSMWNFGHVGTHRLLVKLIKLLLSLSYFICVFLIFYMLYKEILKY